MATHPCAEGLTPSCFKAYPAWAKQAMAYKLLHILLPKQLTKNLPRGLNLPFIAPGVIIPPGVNLPPGSVVPPDVSFPPGWTPPDPPPPGVVIPPGTVFPPGWTPPDPPPPGVVIPPGTVFPPGWTPADPPPPGVTIEPGAIFPPAWTPGDPAPPGVVIPPGTVFPPAWTPGDPAPPGVLIPPAVSPVPGESGAASPIYIPPFSPGPVHPPAGGVGLIEYTTDFLISSTEWLGNFGSNWGLVRESVNNASVIIPTISPYPGITAYNQGSYYDIWRFGFKFNLSALPPAASMVSGYVSIKASTGAGKTCCVQRAPSIAWNNKNDYLSFAGAAEDPKTISGVEQKFDLSAAALAYCKAQAGSYAYFIAREYDHDYMNVAPLAGQRFEAQFCTHADADPTLRPTLTLVYKA